MAEAGSRPRKRRTEKVVWSFPQSPKSKNVVVQKPVSEARYQRNKKIDKDSRSVAFEAARSAGEPLTRDGVRNTGVGGGYAGLSQSEAIKKLAADATGARKKQSKQTAATNAGTSRSEAVKKAWIKRRANKGK